MKLEDNTQSQNYFIINRKLCSLNEYIDVCRRNKYQAAKFKSDIEKAIGWDITYARSKGTLTPTAKPIVVHFEWHEKTKRRDADNIASAKKYILDAMQKYGVIPNDSRRYVKGFHDSIIDSDRDYVVVILVELSQDCEKSTKKS